ncbi:MAG: cardiolipin synthase [Lautropia sp.]
MHDLLDTLWPPALHTWLGNTARLIGELWQAIPGQVWLGLYAAWVIGSVIFMLMQRRRPTATLAWIIAFFSLPLIGAIVYFFFGPRKLRRRKFGRELAKLLAARMAPEQSQPMPATLASRLWLTSLARLATSYGEAPPRPSQSVRLFADGDSTYEAIEAAMRAAQHQIHLEYYIYEPDEIGTRWRDLLIERARAGVAVRVLVDALGSKNCGRRFWQPLRKAGGRVRVFNPPRFLKLQPSLINFRSHRKIVVVDGLTAFTGGINVTVGSSMASSGGAAWRDTHMALTGAPALDLQLVFLEDWLYAGSRRGPATAFDFQDATAQDIEEWFPAPPAQADGPWVQILTSGPDEAVPSIHRYFFTAISLARRRIWLTTPYFVPDEPMMTALATARARGVDVRILLPRRGDSWVVSAAASTFADEIVRENVAVFEYTARMIHAKSIVIDDELAIVGTANIDNRSFRLNFEVVVAIYDAGVTAELAAMFSQDLAHAEQLRAEDGKTPFVERLLASAVRLAAPLL